MRVIGEIWANRTGESELLFPGWPRRIFIQPVEPRVVDMTDTADWNTAGGVRRLTSTLSDVALELGPPPSRNQALSSAESSRFVFVLSVSGQVL